MSSTGMFQAGLRPALKTRFSVISFFFLKEKEKDTVKNNNCLFSFLYSTPPWEVSVPNHECFNWCDSVVDET